MWFRRKGDSEGGITADEALESATNSLEDAKLKGEEVSQIVNAVRKMRERNHFAEAMEALIIRPPRRQE